MAAGLNWPGHMTVLVLLWTIWCILHSLLISRTAHRAVRRFFKPFYPFYRIIYVVFSLLSLLPVLWYQFSLPHQVIIPASWLLRSGQISLLLYAGFMFWAGARVYDMSYFLGMTQWRNFSNHKKEESLPFHSDGILATVRHPWYSGGIAFLWGFGAVTDVFLLTRSILTAYILIGTLLEESRLNKELGEQYREYCRKVPMLIPWKFFSM